MNGVRPCIIRTQSFEGERLPSARGVLRGIGLLTAPACGACAPLAVQPERTSPAPTVTLPLSMAGIADSRQAFAALFDEELRARGSADAARVDAWLHGVSPRTGDHTGLIEALKRAFRERAASTSVLLVPGLFGDCVDTQSVPFGDGLTRTRERSAVDAYGPYADLGLLGIRLILLPGRVSSAKGTMLACNRAELSGARALAGSAASPRHSRL